MGGATEKDWPKRPSDCQLQQARKKDSDRAITPAAEIVVSLHTLSCQALRNPIKLLSFFSFPSVTFFIVVVYLCLYIGLLQFSRVFLFFFFFSFLKKILNLFLFFLHLTPLFAFPTVLSPLQLSVTYINLYLPLFNFAYLFFVSFSPFLSTYLLVLFSLFYSPLGTLF